MSDILTPISRGCCRTLTDGSVRYMIEFGPLEAVAAAKLFGMPGTEMGVVALKDGHGFEAISDETGWKPIATAPEGQLVLVGWLDADDHDTPERYDFDIKDDGCWAKHEEIVQYADAVATGDIPCKMPSEEAPYTCWMRLPTIVPTKDGRDHNEDVLDMVNESIPEMVERLDVLARADLGIVPRALNVVFGDETTAVRANGAGLYDEPMANDQVADAGKTIAKHITLANYAGIFCADPKFWEWIGTKTNKPTCEAEAAHYIRWRCNIASRAEIDNSKIASGIFRQIMREFDAWGQK